jgi:hypothetical protein
MNNLLVSVHHKINIYIYIYIYVYLVVKGIFGFNAFFPPRPFMCPFDNSQTYYHIISFMTLCCANSVCIYIFIFLYIYLYI